MVRIKVKDLTIEKMEQGVYLKEDGASGRVLGVRVLNDHFGIFTNQARAHPDYLMRGDDELFLVETKSEAIRENNAWDIDSLFESDD